MSRSAPDSAAVEKFLRGLQSEICAGLEDADGSGVFRHDSWERPGGGGGESRVMTNGQVFEQAGVGYSHVFGDAMPPSASKNRPELAGRAFSAMGVSLVLHPVNPYVPTTHANFRFFTTVAGEGPAVWWFGGGFDLTPYYPFHEDVLHWHRTARDACQPFGEEYYPRYKKWCDDYFFLQHRNEARGVGGLFFDDLNEPDFNHCFDLVQAIATRFLPAYLPIVAARKNTAFGEREREFQLYRRGRYVEFNLIYDRGTLFGLQSGGRTESILMSLPPRVRWEYSWVPAPGSAEDKLYDGYLQARDWLEEEPKG